jgi:SM-20-related protein
MTTANAGTATAERAESWAGGRILDLTNFRAASVVTAPYPHLSCGGALNPAALPALRRDFPDLREAGFHPLDSFTAQGAFAQLLAEVQDGELSRAMTEKFGIDFTDKPMLITVRKMCKPHEGNAHVDGKSKIATLLIYMHTGWASPDGRIRVLRSNNLNDYSFEMPPDEGNLFTFLRSEHSWHGHTPFEGERRVLQIAWLDSQESMDRKLKRHHVSRFFKKLLGG